MGELMGESVVAAYTLPCFWGKTFEPSSKLKEVPTLMPTPRTAQRVRVVSAAPIAQMPILVIFHRFIELILQGIKIVELRKTECPHLGERIALCSSGLGTREEGFYVLGTAVVAEQVCATDCTEEAWREEYQVASCVGLEQWPSKFLWAWRLVDVQVFDHPVRFKSLASGEGQVWRYAQRGSWVAFPKR